ncbi:MAG: transposase [Ignavibacteriaceae bacterium]
MENKEITSKNLNWLIEQPIETQIELFRHYTEIAKLIANQVFEDEVHQKAGERYQRDVNEEESYSRWGSNPGSIRIGDERVKMRIPRLYDKKRRKTEGLENYKKLRQTEMPSEELIKRIIFGLSESNYGEVARLTSESFGLSQSSVSRTFIEESKKALEEFEGRDLGDYDFIGLVIDGKYLSKEQVVIALGITITGDKIPLSFIHSTTENNESTGELLKELIRRNFNFRQGILTITDGSTGLIKAVKETFGKYAVAQRCTWHKRENVVSYLPKDKQEHYRGKLQRAYLEPDYETAKSKLFEIKNELNKINRSAANSLAEGLEETLTIHRLGLVEELGKSLLTTNVIESLNSQLGNYVRKVKYWSSSEMRARWVAVSLLQIEKRMRKINNYQKLDLLRTAIKNELKL